MPCPNLDSFTGIVFRHCIKMKSVGPMPSERPPGKERRRGRYRRRVSSRRRDAEGRTCSRPKPGGILRRRLKPSNGLNVIRKRNVSGWVKKIRHSGSPWTGIDSGLAPAGESPSVRRGEMSQPEGGGNLQGYSLVLARSLGVCAGAGIGADEQRRREGNSPCPALTKGLLWNEQRGRQSNCRAHSHCLCDSEAARKKYC